MAIEGSLDEASLADVLQLLSLGRKTGRLSVSDQSNLGHIFLDAGRITHAFLANRRQRLGDILFKGGFITQDQLTEAIRLQQKSPEKRVGEILIGTGAISETELNRCMQLQIEEAVYFLFSWRSGDFAFDRDVSPDPEDFSVSINPEALLLEGARRVDEWSVIEKKVPSFDMVFTVDSGRLESSDVTLSEEQRRVASMLDGVRDVATIVAETGMIEFDVGRALYGLITAGFAQAVGPTGIQSPNGSVGVNGIGHLDHAKLLAYLEHEAEFAEEEQRRQSGLHIADCPTCSKRLQEIHIRRSQGLPAISDDGEATVAELDVKARASNRRSGSDRRQSGAVSALTAAEDRRVHGAGDRRSETRAAAVKSRPPVERRHLPDRRIAERRQRQRRSTTPVDRSDRHAVERRSGLERRRRERRVVPRRVADAQLRAQLRQRSTVPLEVGVGAAGGSGATTVGHRSGASGISSGSTHSGYRMSTRRDTAGSASSAAGTGKSNSHGQERGDSGSVTHGAPHGPAEPSEQSESSAQKSRPTRPSVRMRRESPLRGIPLLADGTEWMFVERVDDEGEVRKPADEKSKSDRATVESAAEPAVVRTGERRPGERTTEVDAVGPPAARTTEVDIVRMAPEATSATRDVVAPPPSIKAPAPSVAAPKRRSSWWKFGAKPDDRETELAKRELEQEKRELEQTRRELEKAKSDIEQARSEAARAKTDAEKARTEAAQAKTEAERRKTEAEQAKAEVEQAKSEADRTKAEAEQAKVEADRTKTEAERAKAEAERTRAEAEKAKVEADRATEKAEKAEAKAVKATTKAESVRSEAVKRKSKATQTATDAKQAKQEVEKAKAEAENARQEAEKARQEAERARAEAEEAKSEAERTRSEAERAKSEAVHTKSEAERARSEAVRTKSEAERAKSEAVRAKSEAQRARVEAEQAKFDAEQTRLEAERMRSAEVEEDEDAVTVETSAVQLPPGRGTPVSLSRPKQHAGRGTPVSLMQLVGYTPDSPKPTRSGLARNRPAVILGLAAVAVVAVAMGWFARSILTADSNSRVVSAATPDLSEDTPDVAVAPVREDSLRVQTATALPDDAQPAAAVAQARPDRAAQRPFADTPAVPTPTPVSPTAAERTARQDSAVSRPPAAEPAQQRVEPPAAAVEPISPMVSIAGSVHASGAGTRLAGARVTIVGTDQAATTDATGSFSFQGLPAGSLSVFVELAGYMPARESIFANTGESVELELELRVPPNALAPDDDLDPSEWAISDRDEAALVLGRPVSIIADLWVETIAIPATGTRPRVRVAQLTESGERITLVVSRSGPANSAALPRVTALRIIPATEAYTLTTGTASFGVFMVTAKSTLPAESLRAHLSRLQEAGTGP